ncbi:MAG: TonB-dependent receptor, partial [Bacteroidota bacterium]
MERRVWEIGSRDRFSKGEKSTVVGYVREATSGEPIGGVVVYSKSPSVNVATDDQGFFAISLPNGRRTVHFQHMGMKATKRELALFSDGKLNVQLEEDITTLSGLTITANKDANVKDVRMGLSTISAKDTKNVPIVFGEKDIMKIATTMPGVQTGGEGASGFHVRGGRSDQNLMLLNGATIYNANHFFGFFSVFNSDAIKGMELYKSSIPAQFGGRLSAVFDIESKAPNKEKFVGHAGVSPITSKLILEVPIVKEKAALLLGGRTTYSNWILSRLKNANFSENRASFSDLILRYDHEINANNELVLSGYLSRDKFKLTSDSLFSFSNFSYANANAGVQWKKKFNTNFEGNLNTYVSSYGYELMFDESPANAFTQDFGIVEKATKLDLNYYLDDFHEMSFGLAAHHFNVNPGSKLPSGEESLVTPLEIQETNGLESAVYVADLFQPNEDWSISLGLRYS